ncbi:hypothetical protein JO84_gp236 [Aureococcus anophagefferens virus]|uniref:Uncharacterized protein n=1 Tax=Aureococcus anophagefferens virus TaxID=1474867 RepID=A0A076FFM0_9VIRU|nr:hypothetical protein JO84_gp236 [Aureococcus anophagefferens virus]AII17059.1 hypothetical protein AaV_239 [Aureococcus anophagefferens virus]UOG94153.1 hypothetical protein MKD35_112 [Aureococcus anophagefferens virus]
MTKCTLCTNDKNILSKNRKQAVYNFANTSIPNCIPGNFDLSRALICGDHRKILIKENECYTKDNIVNVNSKRCPKCSKFPGYNFAGQTVGKYCKDHAETGMVNVVSKTCPKCSKQPYFNFEGETVGKYCKEHAETDMVDVVNKKCANKTCTLKPYFNFAGQTVGKYCKQHAETDMVNVVSKTCPKCSKQPYFNFEGETVGLFCKQHAKPKMVNVLDPKCSICKLFHIDPATNKYGGLCLICANHEGLTKAPSNYGKKEKAVVEFINKEFGDLSWTFNQIAFGACSKKKADAHVQFGNDYVLIVEVDENQHKGYDASCDEVRTLELMQDFGTSNPETGEMLCIPIIFIRFNPDSFKNGSKSISSCFQHDKDNQGILELVKPEAWKKRLNKLKKTIQDCIDNYEQIIKKELTIIKLYYDQ